MHINYILCIMHNILYTFPKSDTTEYEVLPKRKKTVFSQEKKKGGGYFIFKNHLWLSKNFQIQSKKKSKIFFST